MTKKFDPKVFQLGYVALETTDIESTKAHYIDKVGMTETDVGHDGESYLSVGYEHHNIVLRKAEEKALLHVGYQLKPGADLGELMKEASEFGVSATRQTDSQPGVSDLVEIEVGGNVMQFYTDITAPAPGFKQTGVAPLRLGHVAVISSEAKKLMAFYEDFLGFWHTDNIGGIAHFYTCNREHHVVNIVDVPMDRVHHIALQLKSNASHTMASDSLRENGVPTLWGPGRHTAGHNLAGYHYDPDKVMIELFTEMDVFVPELGICEPRPWHEHHPMKPREWDMTELAAWGTDFAFNLAEG